MAVRNSALGPWTIMLDAGSRLELSAFWRRRLQAIADLPRARRRLDQRLLGSAVVAAALLAATPLVEFSSAAAAEDEQLSAAGARPTDAEVESDGKFVARFTNGVEVEFIGLSKNPPAGHRWWRPDGSVLEKAPYHDGRAGTAGGGVSREICFRWNNLPVDADPTLSWTTVPHYVSAGEGRPVNEKGTPIPGMQAAAIGLAGKPDTCTVRFSVSVAATPWITAFEDDGRHHGAQASAVGGRRRGVAFAPAVADDGGLSQGVSITVSFRTPDESVRLVAIDKQGAVHQASTATGSGAWEFEQRTFHFDRLWLSDIDHFELQTQMRQIETIEFRNVSLQINKPTKVEIVPSDERQEAQAVGPENEADRQVDQTLSPRP